MSIEQRVVADALTVLERHYPPRWAEDWDRVGLVLGEPSAPLRRVLLVVDCVPSTVEQAVASEAQLIVAHHPLLLRGVSSVAPTTYQGRIVHELIRSGIALYTAHTNADTANPGVSDALAARLGLVELRPLRAASGPAEGDGRGLGRVGRLPSALSLTEFTTMVAGALPATAWGVRASGDPQRRVETVAVCGGSGDTLLSDARAAGADAYLTADLRHHVASDTAAENGPALIDAAHWATERPWLDDASSLLRTELGVETIASDIDTDPWTLHAASPRPPLMEYR